MCLYMDGAATRFIRPKKSSCPLLKEMSFLHNLLVCMLLKAADIADGDMV